MFRPALGAAITSTLRIKATITTFATVFRRDPEAGRLHHDGASDDLYPARFREMNPCTGCTPTICSRKECIRRAGGLPRDTGLNSPSVKRGFDVPPGSVSYVNALALAHQRPYRRMMSSSMSLSCSAASQSSISFPGTKPLACARK
jgi:hypothetical protein